MRWMARPGQHDREVQILGWAVGRMGRWAENRPHLEQTHVAVSHGPVVLDAPDQTREQPAPQVGFLGGQRIQDRDRVRAVSRAQRERPGFEEPAPVGDQLLPDAPQRQLGGRVGDSAGAIGPQLVREGVVAAQAGDLFDEIYLARDVRTPAWDLNRHPLPTRRDDESDPRKQALDLRTGDRDSQQVGYTRLAQEHRSRLLRLRPEVYGRLAHLTAGDRADEVDGAPEGLRHAQHVDATFEAITRFARQAEGAAGASNASRLEVGGLEHDVGRVLRDLGLGAAHDAGHDRGPLGVADDGHLSRQPSAHSVQGDDLFPWFGSAHDDGRAPQFGEVEGMQRLIDLEQDVVGRVHDVVDGPLANALEPRGEPGGARSDLHPTDHRDHIPRRALGILELHRDSVHNGGWADGRMGGSTYHPPIRRSDDLWQFHRRPKTHRHFPGDTLMAQQVRPVRRDIDDDLLVSDRHRFQERRSGRGIRLQLQNPRLIDAEAELLGGAEHAVRLDEI